MGTAFQPLILTLAGHRMHTIMAYYRGQQSPRDESLPSNFATNPLSPPRNPNRLGGGMISSTNDARGSLTRRFTTNALPTLTPIGQQRRQAAENTQMVSTTSSFQAGGGRQHADRMAGGAAASVSVKGNELGSAGIVELLMDSIPSPGGFDDLEKGSVSIGARLGSSHRRGKSCWGAIGDGRPELTNELENVEEGKGGFHSFGSSDNLVIHRLTQETKPNGGYSRMPPVSCYSFLSVHIVDPACTYKHAILGVPRHNAGLHDHMHAVAYCDISLGHLVAPALAASSLFSSNLLLQLTPTYKTLLYHWPSDKNRRRVLG